MKKYLTGRFSYKTDIGKVRVTNEDRAAALTNALVHFIVLCLLINTFISLTDHFTNPISGKMTVEEAFFVFKGSNDCIDR